MLADQIFIVHGVKDKNIPTIEEEIVINGK